MAAAHASVLALQTGLPVTEGRTKQLPSWDALTDFITHCRNVMSDDDLKRELGGKSMQALRAELWKEPKPGTAIIMDGLRSSEVINNELAVVAREHEKRKSA